MYDDLRDRPKKNLTRQPKFPKIGTQRKRWILLWNNYKSST